ncbi:MAG: nucleoside triphosphate pyrophosphohydrolase [Actinomycetota bacterium]
MTSEGGSPPLGSRYPELVRVMAELRAPGGCPWDAEQTHRSLARHLLEEAHEALAAIDSGDPDALKDELGDVLLQVVFHSEIAQEEGAFDVDDVTDGLIAKLVRRHPHVFGDVEVSGADEVLANWEKLKVAEGERSHLEEGIPETLPALARAAKVQRRAEADGRAPLDASEAADIAHARLAEVRDASEGDAVEEAIGDLLFAIVTLARSADVDAESALRRRTQDFAATDRD